MQQQESIKFYSSSVSSLSTLSSAPLNGHPPTVAPSDLPSKFTLLHDRF